ncbi:hypothetical protein O3P69_006440 [Scylla paramamosain]|uniref:Uncharacterized protein n=1 Tax=Scylla paramamosain TaxID=85552 RepID=A0AAW0U2F5_SCYPA
MVESLEDPRFPPIRKRANSTESDPKNTFSRIKCYNYGEGHLRSRYPKNPRAFKDRADPSPKHRIWFCMNDRPPLNYTDAVTINGSWFSTIIRNSGYNCVIFSEEAVPEADVSSCPKASTSTFAEEREHLSPRGCQWNLTLSS